jgi:hypothetical protein
VHALAKVSEIIDALLRAESISKERQPPFLNTSKNNHLMQKLTFLSAVWLQIFSGLPVQGCS